MNKIIKLIDKLNPIKGSKGKKTDSGVTSEQELEQEALTSTNSKSSSKKVTDKTKKNSSKSSKENFANAPQGDVTSDFKTALFKICVHYHPDLGSVSGLGLASALLGKEGYKGDLSKVNFELYQKTLQELVSAQALAKLPGFEVYAHPTQLNTGISKVTAREEPDFLAEERSKRYVNYVFSQDGNELRLKSSIVILPGDEVEFVSVGDCAYVSKLVKTRVCVLGRVMLLSKEGRTATLMPEEHCLEKQSFEFKTKDDLGEAKSGDVVIAEIISRTTKTCHVKTREVVHDLGNLNNIIVMAVLMNDIPSTWPDNMPKALARIPDSVSEYDWHGRDDIRDVPLMTIDGEDARDFDDAVYCRREGRGWRLYVAIADVSYYVRTGSVLDKEAMNRCNSCYFPNYVIPMLPEKLSNGICSLNPNVDRLCMCCEMKIAENGTMDGYRFYPAVMRSHARLTYNEAWMMISEGKAKYPEHEACIENVKELYALYKAFLKDRKRRGGIAIESTEQHFVFDENMEIVGVEPLERNDAHKLIEECMIAANVAAASFVGEKKSQTLYRVHAKPTEKKLNTLLPQLARFGLSLTGGEDPKPQDYAKLADTIAKRKDGKILGEMLLRSMSKAEYTPENIGHFGLALKQYAHFTSPIRRYADLQLHRVIKHLLEKENKGRWGRIGARAYTKGELAILGEKCSAREVAAEEAERQVDFELACVYLEKFIGETVEGTITGCTRFGVFVHLDKFLVDGLIYIGSFPGYMNFDTRTESLISDRGKVYRIGDPIKVVIAAVNAQEHKVDLMPTGLGSVAKYRKERDRILKKREQLRANTGKVDKEELFNKLSDIASPRDSVESDSVSRRKIEAGWGNELSSMMHFADPFAMPSRGNKTSKNSSPYGAEKRHRRNKK